MFINTVTGRHFYVSSISQIPGNIINRGLSSEFVYISPVKLEYARLYSQLVSHIDKRLPLTNTILALSHLKDH